MAAIVNQITHIDGLLVFATEHDLKDGLFAHRLDIETHSEDDLIELVEDTSSLDL